MKNLSKIINYRKPLLIGIGGGNDIVSSVLILQYLKEQGINADLAGMSSPGAWHNYNSQGENPVNILTKNTTRFRPSKNPVNISYLDPALPELLEKHNLNNVNVYNVSLRYGAQKLIQDLDKLIKENNYDGILAIDIGGDVFARGKEHETILSPLMDFAMLYVINNLKKPSKLLEFGLQTDGELRPESCQEILNNLNKENAVISEFNINKNDNALKVFESIYSEIEKIRHGHTAHMTLKTLEERQDIDTIYKFRIQVLDKKWYYEFPIKLEQKYFGKAFLFDAKKLLEKTSLAFDFKDPFELYVKMKNKIDTKSEMDMLYAKPNNEVIWLGLLCPQIKDKYQRNEIINYGLDKLDNHADVALIWKKDMPKNLNQKFIESINKFVLVSNNQNSINNTKEDLITILNNI
ncbi:MAG: DUF1152 domain-containing protein [Candidatus Nanoarchaeia archaeon]